MTIRFPARFLGLLAGCSLLVSATGVSANSFSTLEERMSAKQFAEAGLDKLSAEELAALNAWLQGNPAGTSTSPTAVAATPESRVGFRDDSVKGTVVSALDGTFTGFTGSTVFRLENGQVWQQTENKTMRGVSVERPMITIEPGMLGSWRLQVEGFNMQTKVKRIE